MNQMDKLLEMLGENAKLYEDLVEQSKEEREALENGGIEKLEKITAAKESITFNLKIVEEKRKELLVKISQEFNLPHASITLKELAERPECGKIREKIMKLRERLNGALRQATALNIFNSRLIENAVSVMKKSLLYALPPREHASTYSNGKMDDIPTASGSVLRKTF